MKTRILTAALLAVAISPLGAQTVDSAVQAKVDAKVSEVKTWAADPVIVKAVAAHNASLPADQAAMTQEKWKTLTVLDPFVRAFSKNEAGAFLKTKKADWLTEAFVSDAKGLKVAFLSKPTGWSHAGKAKHDVPMTGKTWQGPVEVDESTGQQQLQVSIPVLDNGQPIGSLVVGLSLAKL